MTYVPPNRAAGTITGWVAPSIVQDGGNLVNSTTGQITVLRGVCGPDTTIKGGVLDGIDNPNLYGLLTSAIGGNLYSIHISWALVEPNRPTGGDPEAGTWVSRDYTGNGLLAALDTYLSWADTNGVYVILNNSNSGGLGQYWSGSTQGYPDWLYDDAAWAQSTLAPGESLNGHYFAPLPYDRTHYGGAYATTSAAQNDAETALFARNTTTVYSLTGSPSTGWLGDAGKFAPYVQGFVEAIMAVGSKHPSVVGYKWFNEPAVANLSASFTTETYAAQEMLAAQAATFDYARSLDPQRFICYTGISANAYHASPDFSILWTPSSSWTVVGGVVESGGGGACPVDHPFVEEVHWYTSGQGVPKSPFDGYSNTDPQKNISTTNDPTPAYPGDANYGNPAIYDPILAPPSYTSPLYEPQAIDTWAALAAGRGVPLYFGEWGISATGVSNYGQYVTDMDAMWRRHSIHNTYFQLGTSTGLGLTTKTGVDSNGNNTYSLNATTGPALAATMTTPFPFLIQVPTAAAAAATLPPVGLPVEPPSAAAIAATQTPSLSVAITAPTSTAAASLTDPLAETSVLAPIAAATAATPPPEQFPVGAPVALASATTPPPFLSVTVAPPAGEAAAAAPTPLIDAVVTSGTAAASALASLAGGEIRAVPIVAGATAAAVTPSLAITILPSEGDAYGLPSPLDLVGVTEDSILPLACAAAAGAPIPTIQIILATTTASALASAAVTAQALTIPAAVSVAKATIPLPRSVQRGITSSASAVPKTRVSGAATLAVRGTRIAS